MFLIDQNNLIAELNKKLILIDTKNAIINNEFKFQNFYIGGHDFIPLNDKAFLIILEFINLNFKIQKLN